jgi:hypothetical protein
MFEGRRLEVEGGILKGVGAVKQQRPSAMVLMSKGMYKKEWRGVSGRRSNQLSSTWPYDHHRAARVGRSQFVENPQYRSSRSSNVYVYVSTIYL